MENWKPVKGYEGVYEVSDLGRVRRLESTVNSGIKHNLKRVVKTRILRPSIKHNYYQLDLSANNVKKTVAIHRLVATAFCDRPEGYNVVNHINCNKLDNRAINLEWCTDRQNKDHALTHNRYESHRKKLVRCNQLNRVFGSSYEAAEFVNNFKFQGSGQVKSIACKIRCAANGIQKTAYGFNWRYVDNEGSTTSA